MRTPVCVVLPEPGRSTRFVTTAARVIGISNGEGGYGVTTGQISVFLLLSWKKLSDILALSYSMRALRFN